MSIHNLPCVPPTRPHVSNMWTWCHNIGIHTRRISACHTTHTPDTHKNGSVSIGREQHFPDSSNHSIYLMKLSRSSYLSGKLRKEPAVRWFGLSFALLTKRHERSERPYRHEPPQEFPLTLPFSSFVHHLSSPDTFVLLKPLLRSRRMYTCTDTYTYIYIYHEPSRTHPKGKGKESVCVLCVM